MELSVENQLVELGVMTTSFSEILESQKDRFRGQIEDLQQVVITQCKLTGVNPLSQEMAAGALSIKIGKRPRDFMNPKAVKYMQFVFSIKDAISKRETREISAQFGVTVTQVRDFFTGQRTGVRKVIRLCRDKADKSVADDTGNNRVASMSDTSMPADVAPLNTMNSADVEEPSCSSQNQIMPDINEFEKYFLENIFILMRKEESFSGQVKLLEWILSVNNRSVLTWFLHEGGVMILATWLTQAAVEEQTSILDVLIKVLQHLPLQRDLPGHVSAIFQSVSRIRCNRTSDISNRARALLGKWSKKFSSSSTKSKSSGDAQAEMLLQQTIDEVMSGESWDLKDEQSKNALRFLCDDPGNYRKSEAAQSLKMLTASGDDSSKKRGVLLSSTRERRKVQMVEHPGQRMAVRDPQAAKSAPAIQSRPLSADDIQKAKMRLQFMQSKQGKTAVCTDDRVKSESQNRGSNLQASVSPPVSKSYVHLENEARRKPDLVSMKVDNPPDTPLNIEEPPWRKYKRIQIPWQTPPEIKIRDAWCVGIGGNSKEVEVQNNRIRRERETFYRSVQEIPLNPRKPWDQEMECDDSLTPEIPIEQLPDVEPLESPMVSDNLTEQNVATVASTSNGNIPEPDLELLAELLKNPALVFALTSGKAGDLSSQDTVKLLDMIKANGVNAFGGNVGNKIEVSLPSPTPSVDPIPNGYMQDHSKNPFSLQHPIAHVNAHQASGAAALPVRPMETLHASTFSGTQIPATPALAPQGPTMVPHFQLSERWHTPPKPTRNQEITWHNNTVHHLNPETINKNIIPNSFPALGNPNPSPSASMVIPQAPFPYNQESRKVSNSHRTTQGIEPVYPYQNDPNPNNYNGVYVGENVQACVRGGGTEPAEFESWSPENSPSRSRRYKGAPNHHDARIQNGYGAGNLRVRNPVRPFGYRDRYMGGAGNERWWENRRWN